MIAKDFTKNLGKIGKLLSNANKQVIQEEIKENTMTQCPKCKRVN